MDFPKFLKEYEIECLISNVSQRKIYLATNKSHQRVVIKESLKNQKESLQNEYEILQSINHPNIIKAIDFFELNERSYLVTPRAEIDLFEYMTDQEISSQIIPKIMESLFLAVSYLHSHQIIHQNISSENILIFKETQFVLAGFGFADHFTGSKKDEFNGKSPYMAPEITNEDGYDLKVDCYSLGVIMYILYKKSFPFDENNTPRFDAIDLTEIPQQAADLISHLICLDPAKRYTARQALDHQYFQNK